MEAAPAPNPLIHVLQTIEWFKASSADERAEIESFWRAWRELVLGAPKADRLEPVLAAVRTLSDDGREGFSRILQQISEASQLFAHVVRDPGLMNEESGLPIALGDPSTLWHAFECTATAACTADTGTLLDLRMPAGEPVPAVKCPRCGNEMRHEKSWGADWAGYGGRSGLALDCEDGS